MLKRPYHVGENHREVDESATSKRVPRPSNNTTTNIQSHEDFFKTFSVDFFEITDDLVTIKVRLNDDRYEGVLKCC